MLLLVTTQCKLRVLWGVLTSPANDSATERTGDPTTLGTETFPLLQSENGDDVDVVAPAAVVVVRSVVVVVGARVVVVARAVVVVRAASVVVVVGASVVVVDDSTTAVVVVTGVGESSDEPWNNR